MPPIAIILWTILLGSVVVLYVLKIIGKKKYQGVPMDIDYKWYENSQNKYISDGLLHQYFFHPDKEFFHQGHLMEDRNHNIVYEAKFLYNNVLGSDEVDFINHIINYKSHHKVGHTRTSSVGGNNTSITLSSTFDFDGQDVYEYLESLGYGYQFNIHGLTYTIDIKKAGNKVGCIYSSNNGKNFFNSQGPIEPKIGGTGICVVETSYENLDASFLYAMVFARTDLSQENLDQ